MKKEQIIEILKHNVSIIDIPTWTQGIRSNRFELIADQISALEKAEEPIPDLRTDSKTKYPVNESGKAIIVDEKWLKNIIIKFQEWQLEHGILNANFAHNVVANKFLNLMEPQVKTIDLNPDIIESIFKNVERIHGNSEALDWIKIAAHRTVEHLKHSKQ